MALKNKKPKLSEDIKKNEKFKRHSMERKRRTSSQTNKKI